MDHERYQTIGHAPGFVEKYCRDESWLLPLWKPMTVFVDNPRKPRGDFMRLLDYLICTEQITQAFE